MKVKFKKSFRLKTGDVPADKEVEIDDALAKSYIKNGYAVAINPKAKSQKPKAKSQKPKVVANNKK